MTMFAEIFVTIARPELTVALLGLTAVVVSGIYIFIKRLFSIPPTPDPWDLEITLELAKGDVTPLCHHCLTPHHPDADFCSNCGAAVGAYTNLMPFPYLFSIGHALRIGTGEHFKKSPLTIFGFVLFGIAQYTLFAPVYWFKLLVNLRDRPVPDGPNSPLFSQPGPMA